MKTFLLLIIFSGLTFGAFSQNAGDLDSTFGINGKVTTSLVLDGSDYGWAVAIQNDGKIIVGGFSDDNSALVRYKQDGSLDLSFGIGGKAIISGASILSIKIQSDEKIVCAGFINVTPNQVAFSLCRFNPNGTLDQTFGAGGIVTTVFGGLNDYGRALALQSDGKILVTGECGGLPCDYSTVRYNINGTLDSTFGNGGVVITNMGNGLNLPKAITVQNDNKIIVVGHAEPMMGIVRYNSDGSLDSSFGTGGKVFTTLGTDSYQTAVLIQPDNKILVAGNYSNGGLFSNAVFRYNADGSPDNSFGTAGVTIAPSGLSDYPSAMIQQQNGDFVIAGTSYLGAWLYFELMKFDGNGLPVTSFGYSGRVQTEFNHYDRCNGLALQSDGKLVAAGYTELGGSGVEKFALARYLNDSIIPLYISGTVTDSVSHLPIANHPVIIDNDTMNGSFYAHHRIVYTNASGVYNDTILLPSDINPWNFIIRTYDCQGGQYYYWNDYNGSSQIIHHDFSIYSCGNSTCQARFVACLDSVSPLTFHFVDQSNGNITSWHWSFGDFTSSTERNPTHTYLHAGEVHHVCLMVKDSINSCCDVYCMDVVPGPSACQANFYFYSDSTGTDHVVHFFDISTGNPAGWDWNFGDQHSGSSNVSSQQNAVHIFSGPGTYTVCLTISGDYCSSSYCRDLVITDTVNFHQLYGQSFAGNFPLEQGLAMILSIDTSQNSIPFIEVSTIDSNGVYYFMQVPDGNYVINAIPILPEGYLPTYFGDVITWEQATRITLGAASNPYNIHLVPAEAMVPGQGSASGQINTGKTAISLIDKITMTLLDVNKTPISFSRVSTTGRFDFPSLDYGTYYLHPELAGITSDMIMIEITPAKPHVDVIMTFTGRSIIGINDPGNLINSITVYPNPVDDKVNISLKTVEHMTLNFEIINMTGEIVQRMQTKAGRGSNHFTLSTGSLISGIYSLLISSDKGFVLNKKLVKLN